MAPINVVLIGKTGSGKSSTGNTVLQKKNKFYETKFAENGTRLLEMKRCEFEGKFEVHIYDTPGFFTLCEPEKEHLKFIKGEIDRLMHAAREIHVFVFVYNFNSHFTPEEKKTFKIVKDIFGQNVLKDHGMLVITHGDNCEMAASRAGKDKTLFFDTWIEQAGSDFSNLISEMEGNMLLVTNSGDFSETSQRLKSSQDLRQMILKISSNGSKYLKVDYDKLKKKCVIL